MNFTYNNHQISISFAYSDLGILEYWERIEVYDFELGEYNHTYYKIDRFELASLEDKLIENLMDISDNISFSLNIILIVVILILLIKNKRFRDY